MSLIIVSLSSTKSILFRITTSYQPIIAIYRKVTFNTYKHGSSNSTTHAYMWGSHSPFTTEIEKYGMSSPFSTTAVGEVSAGMFDTAGASAPAFGDIDGGTF